MSTVRWGVLSTANIGIQKVIPAMQLATNCTVDAIASSNAVKAHSAAKALSIPTFHDNYQALLSNPNIDAIYNPLPNHLHVEWTIKCLEAGKHVLCEKPLANNTTDIKRLMAVQKQTGLTVGEAFMIKSHPQWQRTLELIRNGTLGEVTSVQGSFYYSNNDPTNIRNKPEAQGGAMMDIGCYPLMVARMVFDDEPTRVIAAMGKDASFHTDKLTSAILEFPKGHGTFTVGTQTVPYQQINITGTKKRIEISIPFNAPRDRKTHIKIYGADILAECEQSIIFDACDQYTRQTEDFCNAILKATSPPTDLEDSFKNSAVIEALFESAETAAWIRPTPFTDR